ncbi:MAG: YbaK/EbsC family protein [Nanoarchaeota archaeon]
MEHEAVYTSEQAAKIRGTELKQGCKALICKTENGYIQACVSGAKGIDMDKLKKALAVKEAELADAKSVKKISDCSIGAVPPFGNLFSIPVYFDKSVTKNETVAFNAGEHTKSIKMKSADLVKVTGAKIFEFSR